jgi:hypothetical protein
MGWRCRVPGHIHPAGCPLLPGTSLWITAEQDGEAAAGAMLAMVCARIACFLCILTGYLNCTDLRRTCLSPLRSARCRRQTLRQRMFVVSPNNCPLSTSGAAPVAAGAWPRARSTCWRWSPKAGEKPRCCWMPTRVPVAENAKSGARFGSFRWFDAHFGGAEIGRWQSLVNPLTTGQARVAARGNPSRHGLA